MRSNTHLGPHQTSMMDLFAKIVNDFKKAPSWMFDRTTIACLKLTIEALVQSVKYAQS